MKRSVCPKCHEPNWTELIDKIVYHGTSGKNCDIEITTPLRHCRACIRPLQVAIRFERYIRTKAPGLVWREAVIHYAGGRRAEVERLIRQ